MTVRSRVAGWAGRLAGGLARRAGYELTRVAPPTEAPRLPFVPQVPARADDRAPLPPGAAAELRADHPRLLELRTRYAGVEGPLGRPTTWNDEYLRLELDLTRFRGDNAYVWQLRSVGEDARLKYYLLLRDVAARDTRGLLGRLSEDGLFGCWTFAFPGWPLVSRDLLDSVNELLFLDEQLGILERRDLTVLDIGAGYGRLAHRMLEAAAGVGRYLCVDAVPESTFLCEYYLRFRGCDDRAEVVPLDRLDSLSGRRIDLAVNIHSFPEMGLETVDAWLSLLAGLDVPWLLIVPNEQDRLISTEADGSHRDFGESLARHEYELAVSEPVLPDSTMRELTGISDYFLLFRRR
jgi:hypothetical protein